MKRVLSLALAALMLLTTAFGLVSCGKMEDNGAIITSYFVGEMYDFDPARATLDDDAMRVLSLLYEPLFTLNGKGKVVPALAKEYKIKEDGTMEITLKAATWSDGTKVKAEDVVFAWQRIIDPTFHSQAAPLLYEIENAVEIKTAQDDENDHPITVSDFGAVAVNETVISITFREVLDEDGNPVKPDYDAFLRNLTSVSLAPLRQSQVEKAPDYWGKRSITIVTNGPFTVRTLDYEQMNFTLERNRYYDYASKDAIGDDNPDAHVRPYQIVNNWALARNEEGAALSAEELTARLADAFASKTVFIMSDMPLALRGEKDVAKRTKVNDALSTMTVLLNQRAPEGKTTPLSDATVRRALSEVLDRDAIAELLVYAKPATGFISHGVFDVDKKRNEFREKGGDLLATTAKTAEQLTADETVKKALNKWKNSELVLAYNNTDADAAVAKYVEQAWETLGFKVTLKALSFNEEETTLSLGDDEEIITFRGSQLIDVYDDFAIGNADKLLAQYSGNRDYTSLKKSYFDALIVDYQMLTPDAFSVLAGFSSTLNGNGVNLDGDAEGYQLLAQNKHMTGYASAEYDEKIIAALNERDLEKRAVILHEAEAILMEDMPIIPLTFGQSYYALGSKIRKVSVDYYGNPIFTEMKLKNYKAYLPGNEEE